MTLAAGLLLLGPERVVAQSHVPQGYQLTFSEEFTDLSLDPLCDRSGTWVPYWCKWGVRHLPDNGDEAIKADPSYRGTGGPTLAEQGLLTHEGTAANTLKLYGRVIPNAIRSQYYGFPYVGGMISSERSHAQTYGYWEVRARFTNTSKGHHWAMWLLPQDGAWPPEIDLVEVVGQEPHRFFMNAHGTGSSQLVWFSPDDPSGWHTWGLLWTEGDIIWYVDGVERKRTSNYISKPMYLLISPEIGGSWAGNPDPSTVWPMEAEIDYIRVYEIGSADATAPSVPSDLVAEAVSSSEINLSWSASTDNVGVTRYDVYRGTELIGASNSKSFSDIGLAGGTAYNYRIRACDAAENCSAPSAWVSATTDDDPEPAPSGENPLLITAFNVMMAQKCVEIGWTTNQPADSLVEYGTAPGVLNQSIYQMIPTTRHRLRLSGLSKKALYYFKITSADESGEVATLGSFKSSSTTKC